MPISPEQLSELALASLIECFADLPAPRIERCKRHKLLDIVVIALCAIICGGEGPTDMETFAESKADWLRQFLELPGGIPSHDTFGRVLSLLAPAAFERCLLQWVNAQGKLVGGEIVALDGKTLRGSHDRAQAQAALEIVSAWAVAARLTLGQVKVADEANESTAVPELLRQWNGAGCIVTVDALNCQKTLAAQIRAQQADYVLALKANHKTLRAEVAGFLNSVREERTWGFAISTHQTADGEHGRLETRRYWQATAPDFLTAKAAWRDLTSVGLVEATREIGGQCTTEIRYYLSSLPVNAAEFARAVRGHWGIEHACHWVLDVVFREDQCRLRIGQAAENMSRLRRLALNLLRREKSEKRGIHVKRLKAALDEKYLLKILNF